MGNRFATEADFQDYVLKKLRKIPNSWWIKINDRVTSGIPDIIGCVKGLFVCIELKMPGNEATKLQAYNLMKVQWAQGKAYLCYPKDFDRIYKEIKDMAT